MSRRRMRRSWLRAAVPAVVAGVLVALTAACGGGSDGARSGGGAGASLAPTPAGSKGADLSGVVLRVGDQKAGSQALLDAAGLLKDLPYRIEWSQFPSGPPLLEALNAGAIDVGATGDAPPVFAAAQGSKLTLVAVSRSTPKGAAILVPKDSPLKSLADLKGRQVAVAKGSSAHYHLLAALKSVGLTFADITPTYLQPADGLAAFTAGKVAAWVIWDPFTAIAEKTTGARILATGEGLVGGLGFVEAAPAALADPGRQAALRDYVGRLAKARDWTLANRDAWTASWAKVAGLPEAAARVSVDRAEQRYVPFTDQIVADEQAEADAFAAAGLVPKRPDIAAIVDRRFNDVVAANG